MTSSEGIQNAFMHRFIQILREKPETISAIKRRCKRIKDDPDDIDIIYALFEPGSKLYYVPLNPDNFLDHLKPQVRDDEEAQNQGIRWPETFAWLKSEYLYGRI